VLEPIERVGKPQLIRSPKETEPPEIIEIEMTPEEQDVYALMGISPLVRLNRELKNPKSVILSVVPPGEAKRVPLPNGASVESPSTEAPKLSLLSDEDEVERPEKVLITSPATEEAPATNEVEMAQRISATSSAEVLATEPLSDSTATSELDNDRPVIRRRRRRSSAMDSEDSKLGEG
jgi:ribonuclease E